jgi:hypothetical protein
MRISGLATAALLALCAAIGSAAAAVVGPAPAVALAQSGGPTATSNPAAGTSLPATMAFIQQQLSRAGSVMFSSTLQDSSDENNSTEFDITVAVDDVVADASHCQLSYHQKVARNGVASEQQVHLALRDIGDVVVELFEKYQNEWETRPGFVFVLTDPSTTAVVLVGPKHTADWLAFTDANLARQVGDAIKRAIGLCST